MDYYTIKHIVQMYVKKMCKYDLVVFTTDKNEKLCLRKNNNKINVIKMGEICEEEEQLWHDTNPKTVAAFLCGINVTKCEIM